MPGMPLAALTGLVDRVRATSKKTEKVALIADVPAADARARDRARSRCTSRARCRRDASAWAGATIQAAIGGRAGHPGEPLTLADVDRAFDALAARAGAGLRPSGAARALRALFGPREPDERRFLAELILGEVRQGALDGLVLEAIAQAAAPAAGGGAPGGHVLAPTSARWRAPRSRRARPGWRASRSACSRRSRPCWPAPPRTWRRRWSGWARRPSSTRWTARASSSTRRATRCACSRASSRTSRRACPRSWSGRARCRPRELRAGGRGHRPARRRPAPSLPGHDAPVRALEGRGAAARASCRSRRSSSIASTSRAKGRSSRCPTRERVARLAAAVPAGSAAAAPGHRATPRRPSDSSTRRSTPDTRA